MKDQFERRHTAFSDVVRQCARDEKLVSTFNRVHGANLSSPINALLDPDSIPAPESQEAQDIVCFIGFVHQQIWTRMNEATLRRARQNTVYRLRKVKAQPREAALVKS